MRWLFRANSAVIEALFVVAVVLVVLSVGLILADVFLRPLGMRPIRGGFELSEYALYLITFLSAPRIFRNGEHIWVDVVVARLPPRAQAVTAMISFALTFAACLTMLGLAVYVTVADYRNGVINYKDLAVPQWWLDGVMAFAMATICIEALHRLLSKKPGPTEVEVHA